MSLQSAVLRPADNGEWAESGIPQGVGKAKIAGGWVSEPRRRSVTARAWL